MRKRKEKKGKENSFHNKVIVVTTIILPSNLTERNKSHTKKMFCFDPPCSNDGGLN